MPLVAEVYNEYIADEDRRERLKVDCDYIKRNQEKFLNLDISVILDKSLRDLADPLLPPDLVYKFYKPELDFLHS